MRTARYTKIFGLIIVAVVALISGIAVGKIFVSMSSVAPSVSGTAMDYQDKSSDIETLYKRSVNGASVSSFSAVELYEIADYRLRHANAYYRVMGGNVVANAMGINVNQVQSTYRWYKDGVYVTNKLSPSTSSMAPAVKLRVVYDSNTKSVRMNQTGEFQSTDLPITAVYDDSKDEVYTEEQYLNKYYAQNGTPVISSLSEAAMPYIVSSLTCSQNTYDKTAKSNGDGTYTFSISMSDDHLNVAGMVYAKEINISAEVATFVRWKTLEMKVTIDANFNFKEISYTEVYQMKHKSTGVLSTVTNKFVDKFSFESVPALEEVL